MWQPIDLQELLVLPLSIANLLENDNDDEDSKNDNKFLVSTKLCDIIRSLIKGNYSQGLFSSSHFELDDNSLIHLTENDFAETVQKLLIGMIKGANL